MTEASDSGWLSEELAGCEFKDERLSNRFRTLTEKLWRGMGESIPFACQDWANTKAAYRFLSNDRVTEADILAGHFESTRERFEASNGTVLVLQDTTEFSYKREAPELIGSTRRVAGGDRDKKGRPVQRTVCGILMHSSLVVTTEGLPLGLAAVKFWSRKKFKGCNALKRSINPTRVPIEQKESYRWLENLRQSTALFAEPQRCVHIGDRESDIYELFCTAEQLGTHFLVRTCVDRLAGDGEHTIADEMDKTPVKGLHWIEFRDPDGEPCGTLLEIRYRKMTVRPPIGKQKQYPELSLTVIHAEERDVPLDREPIRWKLMTNLPVRSVDEAAEKLKWYALRWKIETFHKILKSGCKAEESRLRTAQRLANLIAVFCILSWRIFWMSMLARTTERASALTAFTPLEIELLDRLVEDRRTEPLPKSSLSRYLIKLARLGGYLARASDPPPGNKVIWRGWSRLTDIELGFSLASKDVGN